MSHPCGPTALIFLITLALVVAHDFTLQADFDLAKYQGTWFELYRTNNMPIYSASDIQANYVLKPDGAISVIRKKFYPDTQQWVTSDAIASALDPKKPAQLSLKNHWWCPSKDYEVLYTDYDNVAVVYSEWSVWGYFKREYGWILGRRQELEQDFLNKTFEVMKDRTGMDRGMFLKIPQGNAVILG